MQTDVTTLTAPAPVPLYGSATNSGGGAAAYVMVNLHIAVRGTERVISAITDQDGHFTATFTPLPGEAGHYQIGASHPGVSSYTVQDEFTILGMRLNPNFAAMVLIESGSASGSVNLENLSDIGLTAPSASHHALTAGASGQDRSSSGSMATRSSAGSSFGPATKPFGACPRSGARVRSMPVMVVRASPASRARSGSSSCESSHGTKRRSPKAPA